MSRGSVSKYATQDGQRWSFRFDVPTPDGRRKQIQRRGFHKKVDAETAMHQERRRWAGVVNPAQGTFAGYLHEWLEHREAVGDIAPATVSQYRRSIGQIDAATGNQRLDQLTATDLDRCYHHHLTTGGHNGTGRSPRTTRLLHSVIRKALADAVRKGLIGTNPADGATPPASRLTKPPEPSVWSAEEGSSFLRAPWLPSGRRILWQVAFHSGLRRAELCGLRWEDLDGDRLQVVRKRTTADHEVVEGRPKTTRSRRTIHLSPTTLAALSTWKIEQARMSLQIGAGRPGTIFTDAEHNPWHPDAMTRAWARDAKRAVAEGLATKSMRLHDVRHWHATQLVAANTDIRTVADRLGHADAAFTINTYAHSSSESDRAAAAAIEAFQ